MIDGAITVWIAAIGLIGLAPLASRLRWGVAGLALPVGASIYVMVGAAMVAARIPFSAVVALAVSTVIALGTTAAAGPMDRTTIRSFSLRTAATLGAHAAGAAVMHAVHLTRLTADSVKYLITANVLETTGSLEAANPWDLRMRHLVTPLLHAGGVADGAGYSASMTPLFTVSGLFVTAWLALMVFERAETPPKTRWLLLGSVGLLIMTTNRFVYHAFYINGHQFFAVFAVIGVGLIALAVLDEDWRLLVPASLALAALVPLRPEGLLTVAILAIPALGSRLIPYGQRWRLMAPILLSAILWNGVIWPAYALEADLGVLGPVYGNLVIGGGLSAGLGLLAVPRLRSLGRWSPAIMAAAMALYLAGAILDDQDIMRDSLAAMGANLAVEGLWGTLWWIVPLLVAGAWLLARSEQSRLLLTPLPVFALAILAFAYLRGGAYRVGTGDSANRILLHVVLVAALGVIWTAAEATGDQHSETSA